MPARPLTVLLNAVLLLVALVGVPSASSAAPAECEEGARFVDLGLTVFDCQEGLEWEKKLAEDDVRCTSAPPDVLCVQPRLWGDESGVPDHLYTVSEFFAALTKNNLAGIPVCPTEPESDCKSSDGVTVMRPCTTPPQDGCWRLPEIDDSHTILDTSVPGCGEDISVRGCTDPIFGPTASRVYQSATSAGGSSIWGLNFGRTGGQDQRPKSNGGHVRAVHSIPRCSAEPSSCEAVCDPEPLVCPSTIDPVCGCDGITYRNSCNALAGGVSVDFEGECNGNFLALDGRVTSLPPELLGDRIAVGDSIRVLYKFDLRAQDVDPDPAVGDYPPLSRFSYAIGSYEGELGSGPSRVRILDDDPVGARDAYVISASNPSAPNLTSHSASSVVIAFSDPSQSVFSSDGLVIGAPDLSQFDAATFAASFLSTGSFPIVRTVLGEITNAQLVHDLIAFEGEVSSVGSQLAGGPISGGDPIEGIYQLDPTVGSAPDTGVLFRARLRSLSFSFGSYAVGLGVEPFTGIVVENDEGDPPSDTYFVRNGSPIGLNIGGRSPTFVEIILTDPTGSAYSPEAFPVQAPDLSLFAREDRIDLGFQETIEPGGGEWMVAGELSAIRPITRIVGDVDANRAIRVTDAIQVINRIVSENPPPLFCADWNGDGEIDVRDVIRILSFIVGTNTQALQPCAPGGAR